MSRLEKIWYQRSPLALLLLPLAIVFCSLVWLRRHAYRLGLLPSYGMPMPVIVVGNISVGGTGKTPLVIWLVEHLRARGYRPGIISRGYGGKARSWPQQVRADSDPTMVGDEPVLLAQRCGCPMAVGPDRVAAARALVDHSDCDVMISDDGLQHYALKRDVEIAVIDGVRRFGTGFCLPAGPLREPISRLKSVDLVVANGLGGRLEYPMQLHLEQARSFDDPEQRQALSHWRERTVHGVAGIGNPQRFFDALQGQGLRVIGHDFPDHHDFVTADLDFDPQYPILMTEKDAVKCRHIGVHNAWWVPVTAVPDKSLPVQLDRLLAPVFAEGQSALSD